MNNKLVNYIKNAKIKLKNFVAKNGYIENLGQKEYNHARSLINYNNYCEDTTIVAEFSNWIDRL